jgi:Bacterial PH domain
MFSASYDTTTKIISGIVTALLVVVAVVTHSVIAACVSAAIVIGAYAWSPRGYAVSNGSIEVNRLIGTARIPLGGLSEARVATRDDFRGCLRLFGNGGLFGYYGLFQTSKLGKSTWYVTNRGKAVVVVTGEKTVLFSPDDVAGFIAAIGAPAPRPGPVPAAQDAGSRTGTLIGAAIGIVVIAILAFAFLYSPGPPSYTLTPESLTIHDRFYPVTLNRASVDVEHIRIIDLGVDTEWRPTGRTNGFGNAHYASGWFRVASGKTIRMYRAGSARLVLLPPKGDGAAVLLETREPEKFVAEVREKWGGPSLAAFRDPLSRLTPIGPWCRHAHSAGVCD